MASIKERLRAGTPPLAGYLNLIPSPVATQALAAAGADVLVIDQEHGPIGPESLHAMIATTAGTDCMTIAPFDLSTDLGVSGQFDAPELLEAIGRAERVILEAGIPLGGAAMTKEQTQALTKKGYRLLWHNFDVLMLQQFVRQTAEWRAS
jgi:2-keto-3-deoxy-L-rhamnonate aldolase RhmA